MVAADEREVETDVELLRRFPRQLRIGALLGCDTGHGIVVMIGTVVSACGIPIDVLIADRTVGYTQHGVRKRSIILQEFFA